MYTNLGSLMAKHSDFVLTVAKTKPFCILISETWLNPNIPDSLCNLPGYTIYRADNPDNRGYDGVCIFIRKNVISSLAVSQFSLKTPGIDNLFLTLRSPDIFLTIGCIYRPHSCPADDTLIEELSQLASTCTNLVVAGDFNLPELKWPLHSTPAGSNMAARFAAMVIDSNLFQLVSEPTRYRINQTPSLLDLVLTNDSELVSSLTMQPPIGKSDHVCICFNLQLISHHSSRKILKQLAFTDFPRISEALLEVDWGSRFLGRSIEDIWLDFSNTLTSLRQRFTTYQERHFCPRKPWITSDLLSLISIKKALWQRFKRSHSEDDFIRHRRFSDSLSSEIKRVRTEHFNAIAASDNSKKFFKQVRSSLSTRVSLPLLRNTDGSMLSDDYLVASKFADVFSGSFTIEPPGALPCLRTPRCLETFELIDFPPELIESQLANLDTSSSPGLDGFTARLLKECASALSHPLSIIYRTSFLQGALPQAWLDASVTPIFKKGDKLSADNYRPISMVPIVSKIAERIIVDKLLPFLLSNGIIPEQQHGFLPGRSVLTNLLPCVDSWSRSLDRKIPVDVIYLDFSRAFDRVPQRRLLSKLEHVGVRGRLLSWISGFLSDRSFSVKVGATYSPKKPVLSGVPQGTVLGPLLFLIYIADLARLIRTDFAFYADDLKIFADPSSSDNPLFEDLLTISEWCSDWLLPLNTNKCSVLHLGVQNPRHQYFINGTPICAVDVQSDLGVLISSNLSWSEHITAVTRKANKLLYLMKKAFPGCSLELYVRLYTTYVRPLLEHGGPVWCPVLVRDSTLLESIQRRATRLAYGVNRPSYEHRLTLSRLCYFSERRLRGDLIVCYRALHNMFGVDLSHMFQLNQNHLRGHSLKLKKEKFSTTARQVFLSNRVFEAWNGLSEEVVSAPSVNAFKNRLDRLCE